MELKKLIDSINGRLIVENKETQRAVGIDTEHQMIIFKGRVKDFRKCK